MYLSILGGAVWGMARALPLCCAVSVNLNPLSPFFLPFFAPTDPNSLRVLLFIHNYTTKVRSNRSVAILRNIGSTRPSASHHAQMESVD